MRIVIALAALCTLGGCLSSQQDPSEHRGRDFALEEGSQPAAADDPATEPGNASAEAAPTEPGNASAEAAPTVPGISGSTPCGPDYKWCRDRDPAAPAPGADVNCCWNTAKQCYDFAKDPSLCDALVEHCMILPAPPAPVPPPPSEYEQCVIKGKECFAGANDPRDCEAHLARCESLLAPAKPPSAYEQCIEKVTDCYTWSKDAAQCDALRASCESLLDPKKSDAPE